MKVLITGGTGWLGRKLVHEYLARGYDVTILSRNEYNQWRLKQLYPNLKCVLFDIRRPIEIKETYDYCIHTAALKHVQTGINYPDEVLDTNVNGTRNVTFWANDHVKHLIYISSDKAVEPFNWYGQTKEKGEDITWAIPNSTVIRFGNLFGSSGSFIEILAKKVLVKDNHFVLTSKIAERFFLTYKDAIALIDQVITAERKPRLLIGKYKAVKIVDLVKYIFTNPEIEFVGLRPGEKEKEQLYQDCIYGYYTEEEIQQMFSDYMNEEVGEWLA